MEISFIRLLFYYFSSNICFCIVTSPANLLAGFKASALFLNKKNLPYLKSGSHGMSAKSGNMFREVVPIFRSEINIRVKSIGKKAQLSLNLTRGKLRTHVKQWLGNLSGRLVRLVYE